MIQGIIIAILFALALFYIGRMGYNALFVKKGCGGNCKCSVNFPDLESPKTTGK